MEIKDLGQHTYLVGRRVIQSELFNISRPEDRAEMIRIAENSYVDKRSIWPYGDLTVGVFLPLLPAEQAVVPAAKRRFSAKHFSSLHDSAKEILRKEFPEYAEQF